MGSLRVEEPVHTSWSRFCTVNHRALASTYHLSNMKCPSRDSKLVTSEVEVKHSKHYATKSPIKSIVSIIQSLQPGELFFFTLMISEITSY